ncbi:arf-GAP with dual PH domain-containing protein 2 isoform X1 [Alligator mississippiensis]|uniref:Arf-GAP with dual PH domain-containing protein 2 n=1 Tax=Alligator mississippiensis TaxID=8496 RepID=A0A151N2N3_ALLMI|nr:arf-GAP with dual PH domain-containing protein 2 isoform X1 [Alligator mississippiensis]XP_014457447.2 arf-GAP with dual PH domain-containing protein 2 isoform X1 [Alligator mississippiensis]KYO31008.1 arf-GAP with dual PH domain-containing protein 2 [Alligator mississippiensis]
MERDSGRTGLLGLLRASGAGNTRCADCGAPDPEWASYTLGVFICLNCSGIHRNLPEISRVKSLRLDFWEHDLVEFMKKHGNLCAKAIYEAEVPPFYYVPQSKDCLVLREQWIRAKYERKEFVATSISHDACTSGSREGFLWKRGRDSKQFLPRQFILSARDGVLKYYTKESKGPKAVISIKDLNAMFQTEKIQNSHGLQITYSEGGQTRNLFVYHESGKEIVDWFNAIRAARFHYLRTTFPTAPESELVPKITRSYFKEGYMEKTGPTHKEVFKKRWFSLDSQERNLIYFKDPLDAFETGRVIIGSKEHGYEVRASLPRGVKGRRWKAGLTIVTPKREFVFACENDREQKEWMEALNEIISQPMTA